MSAPRVELAGRAVWPVSAPGRTRVGIGSGLPPPKMSPSRQLVELHSPLEHWNTQCPVAQAPQKPPVLHAIGYHHGSLPIGSAAAPSIRSVSLAGILRPLYLRSLLMPSVPDIRFTSFHYIPRHGIGSSYLDMVKVAESIMD